MSPDSVEKPGLSNDGPCLHNATVPISWHSAWHIGVAQLVLAKLINEDPRGLKTQSMYDLESIYDL